MPVTIKDIAKHAGVSHSTVSRALHRSDLISDETGMRIRKIANDLGYFPSAAARSLKTNRSHALGVIVSAIDDPFFSEILQGIEEVAQERGYSLLMAASQRDPEREQTIVQDMRERHVDGLVICSASFSEGKRCKLLDYGIPIVVVNNQAAEEYRYSIYHDDIDGSRQVTRHLIEQGHTRIAYIGNAISGRTNLDRLTGFQQEMLAANLETPDDYIISVNGSHPEDGVHAVQQILHQNPAPTAIFCFNDMIATGVLHGLHLAGLRVPQDMSVVGFDNIVFAEYSTPPLTTLDQPKRYIGAEAARLIIDLLDPSAPDRTPDQKIIRLKGKLLVRHSTASPKAEVK
jgi:DNA-binding LacI/PurR family transcriptional regulator